MKNSFKIFLILGLIFGSSVVFAKSEGEVDPGELPCVCALDNLKSDLGMKNYVKPSIDAKKSDTATAK